MEVATVEAQNVQYVVTAVGSVEAFERVQVTARVAGVVERVRFREGDVVTVAQVLVEIEPRRYAVAVAAAGAALERAEAAKADANAGAARRERALAESPGLLAPEELETWHTKARLASADVAQARALLDQATLNSRDSRVRAPVAGTIETRTVQTGQYLQPGAVLATLVQREPLLLRFQLPEADASRIGRGQTISFSVRGGEAAFSATVTHVNDAADADTRMVAVVAEIARESIDMLRPGTFAQVSMAVGTPTEMPVVPQSAVRPSERGFLAYIVEGDLARERVLTLGMRTATGLLEIRNGLRPGETVVVRGAEALRDGARVSRQAPQAPPASKAPAKESAAARR